MLKHVACEPGRTGQDDPWDRHMPCVGTALSGLGFSRGNECRSEWSSGCSVWVKLALGTAFGPKWH